MPGGVEALWKHDEAGRPTERRTLVGAGTVARRTWRWRPEGQLAAMSDAAHGPTEYLHDVRGRLVGERRPDGSLQHRAMDAVGNLYRQPGRGDRRYGPGGRLREVDGIHYSHDADGNLTEKHTPQGTWRYGWNGAGLLREVQRPDGQRVLLDYDALARRIRKVVLGTKEQGRSAPEREVRFVWDGHVPLHEMAPSEELTTWLFEPESFAPLAKEDTTGRYAVVTDHLGTPTEMYDELGQLAWRMQLDAFGVGKTDVALRHCPWRWPGQYEDEETGLLYNRFRYYDAYAGCYISQDPLALAAGPILYGYPKDPLSSCDPFGLEACNIEARSRQEALDMAYKRAGIPKGTKPDAVWEVGDDKMRRGHPGYLYTADKGSHGRYMHFETENGSRVISEHLNDGRPHFHAGQPKGDSTRNFVDFGWGGDAQAAERYGQVGGKHHIYYPKGT